MTIIVDSMSDGRCGYVVVSDGTREERVLWSESGPISSQKGALDEARRRLRLRHWTTDHNEEGAGA